MLKWKQSSAQFGLSCNKSILYSNNLSYFDELEFDIFDVGGLQCHFITSVTTAVKIRTLSVHWVRGPQILFGRP